MTTQEILTKFETQVDDSTELSDQEELDLANDIYTEIQNDRPWEWLKATFTGVTSISVPYVALPVDFKEIIANQCNQSVVLVGASLKPYIVIPWSARRDHVNQDGYCYIDIPNQRLYFTFQPVAAEPIEFDYIMIAPELDLVSSDPLFRAGFHKIIAFGMASDDSIIKQSDKAKSYQKDNLNRYQDILSDMAIEDANIKLSQ